MHILLKKIDGFGSWPSELSVEGSLIGSIWSFIGFFIIAYLIVSEISDFFQPQEHTRISMDKIESRTLYIFFDITMLALPCSHIDVLMFDSFREAPLEITSSRIRRLPINFDGSYDAKTSYLTTHEDEDEPPLVHSKFKNEEIDHDWDISSEIMTKNSFEDVIGYHDFTYVYFYSDWCNACKYFSKIWKLVEDKQTKTNFRDKDANIMNTKMIKLNCAVYPEVCIKLNVKYYPNIRLFKSSKTFEVYNGELTEEAIFGFLKNRASLSTHSSGISMDDVHKLNEGCRLHGSIETLRVPGEFHFNVKSQERSIVPSMTNVSHVINSLTFGEESRTKHNKFVKKYLSSELSESIDPMKNSIFVARYRHHSPQHYITVVTTKMEEQNKIVYQLTTQSHMKPEDRHSVPQAKFSYNISPMTVVIDYERKHFYQFLTSLCAIMGGAYTCIIVGFRLTTFLQKQIQNKSK